MFVSDYNTNHYLQRLYVLLHAPSYIISVPLRDSMHYQVGRYTRSLSLSVCCDYIAIFQDYTLHLFLRQTWTDSRLNFSHLTNISVLELDQKRISDVWVPDTYFPNEKTASFHTVTVPNKLLHIQKDGYVIYSVRSVWRHLCIANAAQRSFPKSMLLH